MGGRTERDELLRWTPLCSRQYPTSYCINDRRVPVWDRCRVEAPGGQLEVGALGPSLEGLKAAGNRLNKGDVVPQCANVLDAPRCVAPNLQNGLYCYFSANLRRIARGYPLL